ncbi:MAG: A/G-specific adenine glycosylase [Trueperaceae bacterium]|nr:A/G-specific adenine glycosylase [Trueperaceae bacterium]
MRGLLLRWFDLNARALPWRTPNRAPYATLVAEVMLQQTQAARVARAFGPFLASFPDVGRLATADVSSVLLGWQGLGYYRRARALHETARIVVAAHAGEVPGRVDELCALPGIGRYTAVAIAAQAFGVAGIAVDANVRRVGGRVLGLLGRDGGTPRAPDTVIEAGLTALLLAPGADDEAGERARVPEALIELGATLCTPRAPRCAACPLASGCHALARGDPEGFGMPRARAPRPLERSRVVVAFDGFRVALVRRNPEGRWGGLWGFPCDASGRATAQRVLTAVDHVLTHRRLEVTPVLYGPEGAHAGATWVSLEELAAGGGPVPVATLDRKLARRVAGAVCEGGAT